jgi:hypothetical protein
MSAKPKAKPHAPIVHTWSVLIDGTPVEVTAESMEFVGGVLFFTTDDIIVKAVASGHWSLVNLNPPPPEPEE